MEQNRPKKILAVASVGGHWVQMLRITSGLDKDYEVVYMSTHPRCANLVPDHSYHNMRDFSRWNWYLMFPAFFACIRVIRHEHPDVLLSTGAAPGLMALLAAWILGINTVWVDSLANVNSMSLCGKIASHVAKHTFVQWPELASQKVQYSGSVIS